MFLFLSHFCANCPQTLPYCICILKNALLGTGKMAQLIRTLAVLARKLESESPTSTWKPEVAAHACNTSCRSSPASPSCRHGKLQVWWETLSHGMRQRVGEEVMDVLLMSSSGLCGRPCTRAQTHTKYFPDCLPNRLLLYLCPVCCECSASSGPS